MTLDIHGNPEIGTSHLGGTAEQQIHNRWDTIDEVELEMTIEGFPPLEAPTISEPTIDQQLYTTLTSGDGKLLTLKNVQFSAWYSYSVAVEARYANRILQYENAMENARTRLHKQLSIRTDSSKKPTNPEIEREAQLDPLYINLMVELQKMQQKINHVQARVKMHATGKALTSRSVEVRRQDMESGIDGGRAYEKQTHRRYPGDQ